MHLTTSNISAVTHDMVEQLIVPIIVYTNIDFIFGAYKTARSIKS